MSTFANYENNIYYIYSEVVNVGGFVLLEKLE